MKKYNVFNLFVVKANDYYFICEKVIKEGMYVEIFTKEKFKKVDNNAVEPLHAFYSLLAIMNYTTGEPLMLTKLDLLIKYAEINSEYIERKKHYNSSYDKMIEEQEKYIKALKELSEKNPEKAKEMSLVSLKRTGILDENEQVAYPYNTSFGDNDISNKQIQNIRTLKK